MIDEMQEWTLMVTPHEKEALTRLLCEMRSESTGEMVKNKGFLPSAQQVAMYKESVRSYYFKYIAGRAVPHKIQMLHYAAIYDAIALRTGIKYGKFYGPEYDSFLIDVCGIQYNKSETKRGRYRQVANVYKRYRELRKDDELPYNYAKEEEMFTMYEDFLKNVRKEFSEFSHGQDNKVSYKAAVVPREL